MIPPSPCFRDLSAKSKFLAGIGLAAFLNLFTLHAQEQSSALSEIERIKIEQLETAFNLELMHLDESHRATSMAKLRDGYQKRMLKLQKEFTQKGELSKAIIARDNASKDPTTESIVKRIPQISSAQTVFLREQEKMRTKFERSRQNLGKRHVGKLKSISRKLSKANRLDAALEVESIIAKVAGETGVTFSGQDRGTKLPDLSQDLIAYYSFSGNADDESCNQRHLKVNGAKLTRDRFGKTDRAYLLDGKNDYIIGLKELPDSKTLTISIWIDPVSNNDKGALFYDAAYYTPGADTALAVKDDTRIEATFTKNRSAKPGSLLTKKILTKSSWNHVVLTLGSKGTTLFINGKIQGKSEVVSHNVGFHSKPFFGAENHGRQVENYFKGSIDDIRIYDRDLSEEEVNRLYNYEKK